MEKFVHIDDQSKEAAANDIVAAVNARGAHSAEAGNTPLTLAAAKMVGASLVVVRLTAALGAAGAITTDTAENILDALGKHSVGETFVLRIVNVSAGAFAWTVGGGDGVTVTGTATIAQNTWRDFLVTIASATTITMQNIGGGSVV